VDPENTIWDTIQKNNPHAFLWTGDSVYPPTRGIASVEMLQQEYNQLKTNQSLGYATFKPPLGIYGTWDDHDYGGNDLGMEMPQKQERAEAFLQFLDYPMKLDGRHGIHHSVEWGVAPQKIKAILLDTRWNREPHCIPSVAHKIPLGAAISCITRWLTAGLALPKCTKGSILGEEQFAWLETQLQKSNAQIHVIVSSVQVLTSSPVIESWGHFPEDRKRLMKLLNGVSGVVLLSGDVHYAEILAPSSSNKTSTFLEVTSSGLTHDCSVPFYGGLCKPLLEAFGAHRFQHKDNFFIGKNYGTLDVDWEHGTFEGLVHDDEGSVVLRTGPMAFEQDRMSDDEIEQIAPVIDGHLIPKFRAFLIVLNALVVGFLIQRWLRRR
jgi:alkaline phosphatase D